MVTSDEEQKKAGLGEFDKVQKLIAAIGEGKAADVVKACEDFGGGSLDQIVDGRGRGALHMASQRGDPEISKALVTKCGMSVNKQDNDGKTPLLMAALNGKSRLVEALLKLGADPKLGEKDGTLPIHAAAAAGDADSIEKLIEEGGKEGQLEANSVAGTPLLMAVHAGKADVARELLNLGASAHAKTAEGVSCLPLAVISGDHETVKLLLKTDVGKAGLKERVMSGVTPLHLACANPDKKAGARLTRALVEAGADVNATDMSGALPIQNAGSAGNNSAVEFLYPLTKRPSDIEEAAWTVDKLVSDAQTSRPLREGQPTTQSFHGVVDAEKAAEEKREGDKAFVGQDFAAAETHYSASLDADDTNPTVWANRAAARLKLEKWSEALGDSRVARTQDKANVKAWYREGCASKELGMYEDAACAFFEAVSLDPENKALKDAFQGAIDAGRKAVQEQSV